MAVPTPAVPIFTDGQIVPASGLNALGSNITNLWNTTNGGNRTQKDCVIATRTTAQSINNITDTLISFAQAPVNTNNMWVAGQPTQITIQTAGIYWVFGQVRWPSIASPTQSMGFSGSILANGTAYANAVGTQLLVPVNTGAGPTCQIGSLVNLAVGATLYLNAWQSTGVAQSTNSDGGGCYLGAIFFTPSS